VSPYPDHRRYPAVDSSDLKGRNPPILLKNNQADVVYAIVFANHDGWGAVDDGGAASPTGRFVL
jgi:hypothetical protein